METWGYTIVQSQGGTVQTLGGAVPMLQMLNAVGQKGGELVAVVPAGAGLLEWIFKFPTRVPEGI